MSFSTAAGTIVFITGAGDKKSDSDHLWSVASDTSLLFYVSIVLRTVISTT